MYRWAGSLWASVSHGYRQESGHYRAFRVLCCRSAPCPAGWASRPAAPFFRRRTAKPAGTGSAVPPSISVSCGCSFLPRNAGKGRGRAAVLPALRLCVRWGWVFSHHAFRDGVLLGSPEQAVTAAASNPSTFISGPTYFIVFCFQPLNPLQIQPKLNSVSARSFHFVLAEGLLR